MSIRAILIDDEINSLSTLKMDIESYCPQVAVVGEYTDAREAIDALIKLRPDLVFLDIQMPVMTGFELLESLEEIDFHVIFVTAFDQYAVKAFEFNAVDYLMKPVRKSKLIQAVEKIESKIQEPPFLPELKAIINNYRLQAQEDIRTIAIPSNNGYEMIHVDEISYLQAQNNYTFIYRRTGEKYLVSKTIKKMEELIPYSNFYRTHKSYLVNLKEAIRYVKSDGGYLVLKDGTQIPVSRYKREGLLQLLHI